MSTEYWFMFPVAIAIATTAMASGVAGATFFAPVFILTLGLSPEIAIGAGLITEVFGFASGLIAYLRKKLIDYRLGGALLMATVPAALLGTWMSARVNGQIGPLLAARVSQPTLERSLGILFVLIGGLMLGQVLLAHAQA